jgi:hypothetical protein
MLAVHLVGFRCETKPPTTQGCTTMDENTIVEFTGRDSLNDPLNDLLKKGAEKLLSAAIEAEVEALLARFEDRRTAEVECPHRVVQFKC